MTLARADDLVGAARAERRCVVAFNVVTLEHAQGIARGAERAGRPVILQLSHNAVRYHGGLAAIAAATRAVAESATVPLALHLDHVKDEQLLHQAAAHGFGSAMFDAASLPYRDNVAATRAAVGWAHENGLWLEAELGFVGGKPDQPVNAHAAGARTDPGEAAAFVADTGVDALAVAVGSAHAMTARTARLDQRLIADLRAAVPVPLVLHGSSGVPDDELRSAVGNGIVKINIGTALNVAFTGAVRAGLVESVDPRGYLAAARDAVADAVATTLTALAT